MAANIISFCKALHLNISLSSCKCKDNYIYSKCTLGNFSYFCCLLTFFKITGPRSAVGNMSGNRCESDCRSRGCEFYPGPVPYFRGDYEIISTVLLLPSFYSFKKDCCQLQAKVCARSSLTARSSLPRKKVWLGELTVSP